MERLSWHVAKLQRVQETKLEDTSTDLDDVSLFSAPTGLIGNRVRVDFSTDYPDGLPGWPITLLQFQGWTGTVVNVNFESDVVTLLLDETNGATVTLPRACVHPIESMEDNDE